MLTPRPQRPTAYDLVRAVTPPPNVPMPARTARPVYDPHPEPTTERLHRPRVEFTSTPVAAQAGPGPDDCDTCWCPRSDHTRGHGDATGPCKRVGCDTGCTRYRPVWTWRDWARAGVYVVVALLGTAWVVFLIAATAAARP